MTVSSCPTGGGKADLSSAAWWLASGGDARIVCDAEGRNRYGCRVVPEPGILAYGSATASTISPAAWAAVEALWQRLEQAVRNGEQPPQVVYAQETARLRRELVACCGLETVLNLEIVLGTSGTDLHLFLAALWAGSPGSRGDAPPLIVRTGAPETGKGVPRALGGLHFSDQTARGRVVAPGAPLAGIRAVEVMEVPCREESGETGDGLEACRIAADAAAEGRRVLLILADVSKTGLVAPHPAGALALRRRFPESVDVAVDACQFRLSRSTLRAYLDNGFLVAVSGSKFFTGPAFCGALLAAGGTARRWRGKEAPSGLGDYSGRADWPSGWAARDVLDDAANFGLLLRWEAALAEMRAFHRLPETAVASFLARFAAAVAGRLAGGDGLVPLPTPPPGRGRVGASGAWDRVPTIFPFLLRRPGGGWLGRAETARVYEELRSGTGGAGDVRCEIGQPVECGRRDGVEVSALRLCASARLVVEALSPEGRGAAGVVGDALSVLDRAALLAARPSS